MDYKKQILYSILFALFMAMISYVVFTYQPYDCSDLTKLTDYQRLDCRTEEVLGVYYWLPHTTTLFFCSILFYWAAYGLLAVMKSLLKR
ncbi:MULTISPECIES: hypothetical protein [Mannheimia]|uniref:Uncharacterized protein n=2 Tax=Mannheimia pernigra TaxID=111844 RepID=A0A7H8UW33_9PAST|nr:MULTISPECIES: hypothetical protein [Mannheimia]QLB40114.1 hypothetical protein HV559_04070 [Mannheimia pernigra]QLB42101.1 hypothetical protein HV560_04340 [Mannheimia pernigra]QLB43481.1 hypothetical protein HV561_01200 [Mannheimia pernigra]QTM00660.1 hypothetical protein GM698_03060 [Mannheimia sp. ZY171111]